MALFRRPCRLRTFSPPRRIPSATSSGCMRRGRIFVNSSRIWRCHRSHQKGSNAIDLRWRDVKTCQDAKSVASFRRSMAYLHEDLSSCNFPRLFFLIFAIQAPNMAGWGWTSRWRSMGVKYARAAQLQSDDGASSPSSLLSLSSSTLLRGRLVFNGMWGLKAAQGPMLVHHSARRSQVTLTTVNSQEFSEQSSSSEQWFPSFSTKLRLLHDAWSPSTSNLEALLLL